MTVYYVVGRPRSGSTFVGDWIARRLNILNAGEVFQTFRTMNRVEGGDNAGRWEFPNEKRAKAKKIVADPLWSEILAQPQDDPYAALLSVTGQRWNALVDCSKTDRGLERYCELGCHVVIVHTVRAFTTWRASLTGYRRKYGLEVPSRSRLLLSYLRLNRSYRALRNEFPYHVVPQERLAQIADILELEEARTEDTSGYANVEMFGTPDFIGQFDPLRATQLINPVDRVLYTLIGVQPGPARSDGVAK